MNPAMTRTMDTGGVGTAGKVAQQTAHEYLRVSQDGRREKSQDDQQADNGRQRVRHGWAVGKSYREPGSASASRFGKVRATYTDLIDDLRAGRVFKTNDVLMVWESSRTSRQLDEWSVLIKLCAQRRIFIYITMDDREYRPWNASDRKALQQKAIEDEYSSEQTSTRVKRGLRSSAADGKPHGPCLFGYERIYDPRTKEFVEQRPSYPRAQLVTDAFNDALGGMPLTTIARLLTERDVATGDARKNRADAWSTVRVRSMLTNISYIGLRKHTRIPLDEEIEDGADPNASRTDVVTAQWPGLIEPELFYALQEKLAEQSAKGARPTRVRHLLSMFAVCGACGSVVTARLGDTKATHGIEIYRCRDKGCVRLPKALMDAYASIEAQALLSDPELWRRASIDTDEVQTLRDDLAEVQSLQRELLATAKKRRMRPALLAAMDEEYTNDIERISGLLKKATRPASLTAFGDGPDNAVAGWDLAPLPAQRDFIRENFDVVIYPATTADWVTEPAHHHATVTPKVMELAA